MKKKRMSLTKDSERRLREFRVGAGLVAYKVDNNTTGSFEFYTDPNGQMRFVGNGKLVEFEIEYDEDGFEIYADAVEKQETTALQKQLADAQAIIETLKSNCKMFHESLILNQQAIEKIKHRAERPSEDPFDAPADILAIIEALHAPAEDAKAKASQLTTSGCANCGQPFGESAAIVSHFVEGTFCSADCINAYVRKNASPDDEEIVPATLEEVAQIEAEYQAHLAKQPKLSAEEIDWFARHYSDHDEFRLLPEEGYVDWLDNKAVRFYTSLNRGELYELRESYNTPANHAAIAKRRDELTLGEQS